MCKQSIILYAQYLSSDLYMHIAQRRPRNAQSNESSPVLLISCSWPSLIVLIKELPNVSFFIAVRN